MSYKYKAGLDVTVTINAVPESGSANYGRTIEPAVAQVTMISHFPASSKFTLNGANFSDSAGNTNFAQLMLGDVIGSAMLYPSEGWVCPVTTIDGRDNVSWLQYDFLSPKAITSFSLGCPRGPYSPTTVAHFVNTFEMWKSQDAIAWSKVGDYTNGGDAAPRKWHTFDVATTLPARYWRIYTLTPCTAGPSDQRCIGGLRFYGY